MHQQNPYITGHRLTAANIKAAAVSSETAKNVDVAAPLMQHNQDVGRIPNHNIMALLLEYWFSLVQAQVLWPTGHLAFSYVKHQHCSNIERRLHPN